MLLSPRPALTVLPVQVSILTALANLLCTLHSLAISTDQICPWWPSSIRVSPIMRALHASAVRIAPPAHDHASGSLCRTALPQCLLDADELCTPDPGLAGARATEHAQRGDTRARMAEDVWRLGALGTVMLAACGRADPAACIARAGTPQELLAELALQGRFTAAHPVLRVRTRIFNSAI